MEKLDDGRRWRPQEACSEELAPQLCFSHLLLCSLPFAFTPLRRRLAALTPLVQKEASRRELNRGEVKWMDGWWIYHGVGGLWHKAPAALLSDDGGGASRRGQRGAKKEATKVNHGGRADGRSKAHTPIETPALLCSGSFPLAAFRHLMLPKPRPS